MKAALIALIIFFAAFANAYSDTSESEFSSDEENEVQEGDISLARDQEEVPEGDVASATFAKQVNEDEEDGDVFYARQEARDEELQDADMELQDEDERSPIRKLPVPKPSSDMRWWAGRKTPFDPENYINSSKFGIVRKDIFERLQKGEKINPKKILWIRRNRDGAVRGRRCTFADDRVKCFKKKFKMRFTSRNYEDDSIQDMNQDELSRPIGRPVTGGPMIGRWPLPGRWPRPRPCVSCFYRSFCRPGQMLTQGSCTKCASCVDPKTYTGDKSTLRCPSRSYGSMIMCFRCPPGQRQVSKIVKDENGCTRTRHTCVKYDMCAMVKCAMPLCQKGYHLEKKGCCQTCVKDSEKPKLPACPTLVACQKPLCKPGQKLETPVSSSGKCTLCPRCVGGGKVDCSRMACPMVMPICKPGYKVGKAPGQCCNSCIKDTPKVDCSMVKCAMPLCLKGYTLEKVDGACCPKCVPTKIKMPILYRPTGKEE
eukprot:TRINITY_DN3301_c2_g1_i4.p1 TRINITY_DN3301_c2_g1~~TRINITY_DN3301_c2_g1_i4.p1  ORF type:complete len:483 (-),score=116.55 TRINITY_DN3301_c2_g1_i4:897-2345(-)